MKHNPFEDGGALLADSTVYIERKADRQAIDYLIRMKYITLVEPRQQGKTSLIHRLTGHMTRQGYVFAYADLTAFDQTSEAAWYESLCDWLLRQMRFIAVSDRPKLPVNANTWRNFLCNLAEATEKAELNLVLVLDEASAAPATWATDFFSAVRSIYNSRQTIPCFQHLTFIVAGAFSPRELIRDRNVSDFNVANQIRLDDFDVEQVQQLVSHLELADCLVPVAERLHYWTNGQPFITQRLCRYLAEQDTLIVPDSVDAAVERFFREDTNHLSRILSDLRAEPELLDYARNAIARRSKFSPSVNDWQFRLSHVIGVIAPDQDGRCRIRNRIYEQALQFDALLEREGRPNPLTARKKEANSMDIPVELLEQLRKGNVVLFCGAGISISDGGIPSGGQLAHELAQRAGLGDVGNMSLPEVAQAYELEMGTQSLIAYVTERVDDPSYTPLRTHHLIAALPFKRIITTNWDNLLEEALRQARKPFVKVVRDSEVPFTDDEKVLLIKLHGSAEQKDTIVITGDDYYNVFARLPQVANLVQSLFATKTLLFFGYGLADEDFKRLYMEVVRHLGKHKRRAYAVQLNPTPLTIKYWEQKNVQVIAADATAFLESLAAELGAQNPPLPPVVTGSQPPTGTAPTTAAAQTTSSPRQRSHSTGQFNLERGLQVMKDALRGGDPDVLLEFSTLESRLLENVRNERLYGSTETRRSERAQIVQELNRLALEHCGVSFNDLCLGEQPTIQSQLPANSEKNAPRLHRVERLGNKQTKGEGESANADTLYGVGNRWAVLVGVNEYDDQTNYGRLHVCVKDVHAVRDQLLAGSFDPARIRLLTDDTADLPTRDNILVALKAIADATEPDDLLLFYYSGHGDEEDGESYLVARNGRRLVLSDTAVRVSRVKEILEKAPARAKVIILDACHSGADIGGKGPKPMSAEFIRRVFEQAAGMAILASCTQGQLSYEWQARKRSVFTHFLLEALRGEADRDEKGFVTVQDANRYVVNGVKLWASQRNVSQTPTLEYRVAGDIVLTRYAQSG